MQNNQKQRIANIIKSLRKSKGLTQKQLAKETGLGYSTIINYENGLREPNSKSMAILESYFNVSGAYLRGETEYNEPEYIWENKESAEEIHNSLPVIINKILELSLKLNDEQQHSVFVVFQELNHILSMKSLSDEQRETALSLLLNTTSIATKFIDFCDRAYDNKALELPRIENCKISIKDEFALAIEEAQDRLLK